MSEKKHSRVSRLLASALVLTMLLTMVPYSALADDENTGSTTDTPVSEVTEPATPSEESVTPSEESTTPSEEPAEPTEEPAEPTEETTVKEFTVTICGTDCVVDYVSVDGVVQEANSNQLKLTAKTESTTDPVTGEVTETEEAYKIKATYHKVNADRTVTFYQISNDNVTSSAAAEVAGTPATVKTTEKSKEITAVDGTVTAEKKLQLTAAKIAEKAEIAAYTVIAYPTDTTDVVYQPGTLNTNGSLIFAKPASSIITYYNVTSDGSVEEYPVTVELKQAELKESDISISVNAVKPYRLDETITVTPAVNVANADLIGSDNITVASATNGLVSTGTKNQFKTTVKGLTTLVFSIAVKESTFFKGVTATKTDTESGKTKAQITIDPAQGTSYRYTEDTAVTITIVDPDEGTVSVTDNGKSILEEATASGTYTKSITMTAEAGKSETHKLTVTFTDYLGETYSYSLEVTIDKESPSIDFGYEKEAGTFDSKLVYSGDHAIGVKVDVDDAASATYTITKNGKPEKAETATIVDGSFTVTLPVVTGAETEYSIEVTAADQVPDQGPGKANTSTASTATIVIDDKAPEVTVPAGTYSRTETTLTAKEAYGIQTFEVEVDGEKQALTPSQDISNYSTTLETGHIYNAVTITDLAGNTSPVTTLNNYVVDKDNLTVSVEYSTHATDILKNGIFFWSNKQNLPLEATLTAEGNLLGIKEFSYSLDGSNYTAVDADAFTTKTIGSYTYNASVTCTIPVTEEGKYSLSCKVVEEDTTHTYFSSGLTMVEDAAPDTLVVDDTYPDVKFIYAEGITTAVDPEVRIYQSKSMTVDVVVTEEYLANDPQIQYVINGDGKVSVTDSWVEDAANHTYTKTATLSLSDGSEGADFVLTVDSASDYAGNTTENITSKKFVLDTVEPTLTVTTDPGEYTKDTRNFFNAEQTLKVTVDDFYLQYYVAENNQLTLDVTTDAGETSQVTGTWNGTDCYTFALPANTESTGAFEVKDAAGNPSESAAVDVVVDTKEPEITVTTDPGDYTDGTRNYYQAEQTLIVTVTDNYLKYYESDANALTLTAFGDDNTESSLTGQWNPEKNCYEFVLPANAVSEGTLQVKDPAGNPSNSAEIDVVIDSEDPKLEVSYSEPASNIIWDGIRHIFWNQNSGKKNLVVTFKATDNLFGVSAFGYKLGDAAEWTYVVPDEVKETKVGANAYTFRSSESVDIYDLNTEMESTISYVVKQAHDDTEYAKTKDGLVTDNQDVLVVDNVAPGIEFTAPTIVASHTHNNETLNFCDTSVYQDVFSVKFTVTDAYFQNENAPVSETATDNLSGHTKLTVTKDGVETSDYTATEWKQNGSVWEKTITVGANATYNFALTAYDYSDNSYTYTSSNSYVLDTEAPVITITPDWTDHAYTVQGVASHYSNRTNTATVTVTDKYFFGNESSELCTIDAGGDTTFSYVMGDWDQNWEFQGNDTYTSTITLNSENDFRFVGTANDYAKNQTIFTSDRMVVDMTAPVVTIGGLSSGSYNANAVTGSISVNEKNLKDDNGFNGLGSYTNSAKTIDGTAVSSSAAIAATSAWATYGSSHSTSTTFSTDANYTFGNIQITDLAGNTGSSASYEFCVDMTDPMDLDITYSNDVWDTILKGLTADILYYDDPVEVTLHATDVTSGVETMTYTCTLEEDVSDVNAGVASTTVNVDASGSTAEYTFSLPAEALNDHNQFDGKVSFTATDRAGNTGSLSDEDEPELVVDDIAPDFSVRYTEPSEDSDDETYYYNEETGFNATFTINEANFDNDEIEVKIMKDEKEYTKLNTDFTDRSVDEHELSLDFTEDGEYTITVTYTDHSQNDMDGDDVEEATYTSPLLVLDHTEPEITFENMDGEEVTTKRAYDGKDQETDEDEDITMSVRVEDDHITASDVDVTLIAYMAVQKDDGTYAFEPVDISAEYLTDKADGEGRSKDAAVTLKTTNLDTDAVYFLDVAAKDQAGNEATANTELVFSVNRDGSTYYLDGDTAALNGSYVNAAQDVVIHEISDEPLAATNVTVIRDGTSNKLGDDEFNVTENLDEDSDWYQYDYSINAACFESEGDYSVETNSEANAVEDNGTGDAFNSSNSDAGVVKFTMDTTVPDAQISGAVDGDRIQTNKQTLTITLSDNKLLDAASITVNGEAAELEGVSDTASAAPTYTLEADKNGGATKKITVTVKDKAGNEFTTDEIEVRISSNIVVLYANLFIIGGIVLLAALGVLIGVIVSRKKKAKNAE